jgi:hypothetical protein
MTFQKKNEWNQLSCYGLSICSKNSFFFCQFGIFIKQLNFLPCFSNFFVFISGMIVSSTLASIYSVLLIGFDRFLYILKGMQYQIYITLSRARFMIAGTWIIGGYSNGSLPRQYFKMTNSFHHGQPICLIDHDRAILSAKKNYFLM